MLPISVPRLRSGFNRSVLAIAVAISTTAAPPGGAQGQSLARPPSDDGARYSGWPVERFDLRFGDDRPVVEPFPDDLGPRIRSGLALHGRRGLLGRDRPAYSPRLLAADVRRLRLYLAREGYPQSSVAPEFYPDLERERLELTLSVIPGHRVRVEGITVTGVPDSLAGRTDSLVAREIADDRYSDRRVEAMSGAIGDILEHSGYAKVTVESRPVPTPSGGVTLRHDVTPGDPYRITRVRVEGVTSDIAELSQKRLRRITGEPYSPGLLGRASDDLRGLEVLRSVRLETEPIALGELELRALLSPRAPRETSASVGTWSDHSARVKASWRHRNLFRGGRGVSVGGAWSPNQWEVETATWWPWMPVSNSRTRLRLAHEAEREEAYRSDRTEVGLGVTLRTTWATRWFFETTMSRVEVEDRSAERDAFDEGAGRLLTFAVTRQADHTDDLLDPTRGVRLKIRGDISPPGFISDFPCASGDVEGTAYVRLLERVVVAARVGVGMAAPLGDAERLLPDRRFFAGGNSSMRGYGRRELGPTDGDGRPLGGSARMLAGAELRLRLTSWLGLPLFADGGGVWARRADLDPADLEWALGSGVMFFTPVGPLRVDGAFNVTGDSGERDGWRIHLSIGHAY